MNGLRDKLRNVTPPLILSIAGFDPSSGAGVTADLKVIAAHNCYGVSCLTALTVQSTQGVRAVEPLNPAAVTQTLDCLAEDFEFAAVKIGMLGTGDVAAAIADFLERYSPPNLVLDPVLASSSGQELLEPSGQRVLLERLFPLARVVTPNVDEARILAALAAGKSTAAPAAAIAPGDQDDYYWEMAEVLLTTGAGNVVITGGHRRPPTDLLLTTAGSKVEFPGKFVYSGNTHGTGCAFSSAVACNLALGHGVEEAVVRAKDYVTRGLIAAYRIGKGTGPLNHFPDRKV